MTTAPSNCPSCEGRGWELDKDGAKDLCYVCGGQKPPATGEEAKLFGQQQVAEKHEAWMVLAHTNLARLCSWAKLRNEGVLTADDFRSVMGAPPHPNCIGAIFSRFARNGKLADTGRVTKSTRPEAHSRKITIWEVL
jgi:hypothetical protein